MSSLRFAMIVRSFSFMGSDLTNPEAFWIMDIDSLVIYSSMKWATTSH